MNRLPPRLVQLAAARYATAGTYARHFAAGKLAADPVFVPLLRDGLLAGKGLRLLDLGCGQGLLAALCRAAGELAARGDWPAGWAPPPAPAAYHGIELVDRDASRGRAALPAEAPAWRIDTGDLRTTAFAPAERIVLLDVLHYLPPGDQAALLARVAAALAPGGRVVARVGDAGGKHMLLAGWIDRLVWLGRRGRPPALHHRPLADWHRLLAAEGLLVEHCAPVPGERFGNQLLLARRVGDPAV